MALRKFRPLTPAQRFRTVASFDEITRSRPEPRVTEKLKKTGGRDNRGHISSWLRGGGFPKKYRIVDFKRDKRGIPAKVAQVEPGNAMPLSAVPLGTFVYNVELIPGKGGQLSRSAGTFCQVMARDGDYAQLRLPSGEMRKVPVVCICSIGMVGNEDHQNIVIGKAGKSRWMGRRPSVRGVAMNPVDHPMGGGEGKSSGGRHPCSPWGLLAKGKKTRKRKLSDRLIVRRRKQT